MSPQTPFVSLGLPFSAVSPQVIVHTLQFPALFISALQITLHTLIKPRNTGERKAKGTWGCLPLPLSAALAGSPTPTPGGRSGEGFPPGMPGQGVKG